jgi:hypothetical protein
MTVHRADPRESCRCDGGADGPEHRALVMRVNASFEKDRERALLGMAVASAEALRRRAIAPTNGHA